MCFAYARELLALWVRYMKSQNLLGGPLRGTPVEGIALHMHRYVVYVYVCVRRAYANVTQAHKHTSADRTQATSDLPPS